MSNTENAIGAGLGILNINNVAGQGFVPSNVAGQGYAAQNAAYRDKTPAEFVSGIRRRLQVQQAVLEYLEAQLNMDLFRADPAAQAMYSQAMHAAVGSVMKSDINV